MAFTEQETVFHQENSGDTTVSFSLSGAPSSGELVVLYANVDQSGQSITPQAGGGASWTLGAQGTPSGETAYHGMWWKVANGSEPSTITYDIGIAGQTAAVCWVFSSASDAEVENTAVNHISGSQIFQLNAGAANGITMANGALSILGAGKDFRPGSQAYTQADQSFIGVVGNQANQTTAGAHRIYTSQTTISGDVVIRPATGNDLDADYTYSIHMSFVESGGGGPTIFNLMQTGVGI